MVHLDMFVKNGHGGIMHIFGDDPKPVHAWLMMVDAYTSSILGANPVPLPCLHTCEVEHGKRLAERYFEQSAWPLFDGTGHA